eukprot:GDKJ01016859.1.p2 GENE.GDKJ01016859.1~~GDKJ01016859.1.p2  ORF type:complete len:105 (-),score=3.90 GDKJ01016859.1:559-873(-)
MDEERWQGTDVQTKETTKTKTETEEDAYEYSNHWYVFVGINKAQLIIIIEAKYSLSGKGSHTPNWTNNIYEYEVGGVLLIFGMSGKPHPLINSRSLRGNNKLRG